MNVDLAFLGKSAPGDLPQIALGFLRVLQVRLAVHLIGGVSLHDVHEGDARPELFGQKGGCRQGGLGHGRTIYRDKDMLEHGVTQELLSYK